MIVNHFFKSAVYVYTGCGRFWSIDGNWKIRYPVCMYFVPKETAAFKVTLGMWIDAQTHLHNMAKHSVWLTA